MHQAHNGGTMRTRTHHMALSALEDAALKRGGPLHVPPVAAAAVLASSHSGSCSDVHSSGGGDGSREKEEEGESVGGTGPSSSSSADSISDKAVAPAAARIAHVTSTTAAAVNVAQRRHDASDALFLALVCSENAAGEWGGGAAERGGHRNGSGDRRRVAASPHSQSDDDDDDDEEEEAASTLPAPSRPAAQPSTSRCAVNNKNDDEFWECRNARNPRQPCGSGVMLRATSTTSSSTISSSSEQEHETTNISRRQNKNGSSGGSDTAAADVSSPLRRSTRSSPSPSFSAALNSDLGSATDFDESDAAEVEARVQQEMLESELAKQRAQYEKWLRDVRDIYEAQADAQDEDFEVRERILVDAQQRELAALGGALAVNERALALAHWRVCQLDALIRAQRYFNRWHAAALALSHRSAGAAAPLGNQREVMGEAAARICRRHQDAVPPTSSSIRDAALAVGRTLLYVSVAVILLWIALHRLALRRLCRKLEQVPVISAVWRWLVAVARRLAAAAASQLVRLAHVLMKTAAYFDANAAKT